MSLRPRPYASANRYPVRAPTFLPRAPAPVGPGAGLGGGAGAGGLTGLIGGLAVPILCLGCLASLALIGLFATMIGAAAYMNGIQHNIVVGAGSIVELNLVVLFCALLSTIYVLTKYRRDAGISH